MFNKIIRFIRGNAKVLGLGLVVALSVILFFGNASLACHEEPVCEGDIIVASVSNRAVCSYHSTCPTDRLVAEVNISQAGYYSIESVSNFNSGDAQLNESYFLVVKNSDGTIQYAADGNAGQYYVVEDAGGPASIVIGPAGTYYFDQGVNKIYLKHYVLIFGQYPQFLNSSMGYAESVSLTGLCLTFIPPAEPVIDLEKDGPDFAEPGDEITYTLGWSVEDNSVTNLVLTDPIPDKTSFVSASHGGAYNTLTNRVTWNLGDKNAGNFGSVTLVVKIDDYTYDDDVIFNRAVLDSDETDSVEADKTTVINASCNLIINKVDDIDPVEPGEQITYTITYENIGNAVCVGSGVIVTDVYDLRTSFVSANPAPTSGGSTWSAWNVGEVIPDGPHSIQVTVVVDGQVENEDVLVNEVCILADNAGCGICDIETTTVVIPPEPYFNLAINKSADKQSVAVGENLTYTLDWEVTGNANATGVVITDTLPDEVSLVSADGSYTTTTNQIIWNLGDITPDDLGSLDVVVSVDSMPSQGETILNHVLMESGQESDEDEEVTTVLDFELLIDKTAPAEVNPGAQMTYTINWEVTGNTVASDVRIFDYLPEGVDVVSADPNYDAVYAVMGNDFGVYTLVWNLGDVTANATGSIEVVVAANPLLEAGTELVNNVKIESGDKLTDDSASTLVTLAPYFNLAINKSADKQSVAVGENLTYTLDWEVTGNANATGVVITDTLPAEVSLVSADGSYTTTTNQIIWNLGDITPDDLGSLDVVVSVDSMSSQGETILNHVLMESGQESDEDEEVTTVVPAPDFELEIIKTAPEIVNPGGEIVYTIDWEVTGNALAPDVVITDSLSNDVAFVSATDGGLYSIGPHSVIWSLGDITPNTTGTVSLVVLASDFLEEADKITNDVEIASDGKSAEDSAVTAVTIAPYFNLSIDKTADKQSVLVGQELTYTLNWEVTGNTNATGVVITDSLPAEVSLVSASPGYSLNSNQVIWHLGDITPDDLGSLEIVVRVDSMPSQGETILNHVLMESGGDSDEDEELTTVVDSYFVIDIEKTGPAEVEPGDNITFNIIWSVSGNATATDVVITDSLPSNASFVSATGSYVVSSTDEIVWNLGDILPDDNGSFELVVSTQGLSNGDQVTNNVRMTSDGQNVSDSATTQVAKKVGGCVTNCGGGGFTPRPSVSIDYIYPFQKEVGSQYVETITVTNTGNVILTNGVLTVNFPEEYISFVSAEVLGYIYDDVFETLSWQIPALSVGASQTFELRIEALKAGTAVLTLVGFVSDQADGDTTGEEDIIEGVIPPPPPPPPVPPTPTPVPPTPTPVVPVVVAPAATVAPVVQGECDECPQVDMCEGCSWWVWLIIILLLVLALLIYWFYVSKEEIKENEEGEYHIIKGNWAWALPVVLILAIIFLILAFICHLLPWWILLIVLAAYYLALVSYQLLLKKAKVKYSPFLPILVTLAILAVYFICHSWVWWVWLVILVLYILTLGAYYLMIVKMDAKSRNYWWLVVLFMTMLTGVLLMVIRLCQCQEVIR